MSKNGSPRPENHVIVLFGATGDLAKRKLLPGLFHLHAAGLMPHEYRIIGSSPASTALTDEQFREHAEEACSDFCITKPTDPSWPSFAERLSFAAADPDQTEDLVAAIQRAEQEIGGSPRRLYHLAVPPAAFTSVVGMIGAAGLVPIIEPEVSISSPHKEQAETLLHDAIVKHVEALPESAIVMVKITIPTRPGLYGDVAADPRVLRVVALSGGYSRDEACARLARDPILIASFSRALLEGLTESQTDEQFNAQLEASIEQIYQASVHKRPTL